MTTSGLLNSDSRLPPAAVLAGLDPAQGWFFFAPLLAGGIPGQPGPDTPSEPGVPPEQPAEPGIPTLPDEPPPAPVV